MKMKSTSALLVLTGTIAFATPTFSQNVLPTSGNVGVGTVNPTSALEVNGETKLGSVIVRDTARFEYPVIIKDSVTIERKLRVDQDVRIIGNTVMVDNAKAKSNFTVEGTTKLEGNLRLFNLADSTQQDDKILIVRPNGLVKDYSFGELKALMLSSSYGSDCKLDDNGVSLTNPIWKSSPGILYTGETCPAKVGIGIAAPTDQLHVVGSGRFTGNVAIGTTTSAQNKLVINQNAPNRNGLLVEYTNTNANGTGVGVQINMANGTRKAFVVNDGTGDVFRVMGNGTVWATEVHVRLKQDFPDYVFQEGYDLITIKEIEEYIKMNGHLPNMPTAEQVATEGIDLGEMNRILVEKMEELTLYIIELQKQIDVLNSK